MTPASAPSLCAAGLAAVALAAADPPPPLLVNESASVPRGLYLRIPGATLRPGRLVAARPPQGEARSYLEGLGAPPGQRLLKRVAATAGEEVCVRGGALMTPRASVAIALKDRRGVRLPSWGGCRSLAPGEMLLLGDTEDSFDGRYFGPVRRRDVEGPYVEVLRW